VRPPLVISETQHGFICASAGVDASNAPEPGTLVLLPLDPDGTAARIRDELRVRTACDVGVIVTDSFGRPWRQGTVDVAIGAAGASRAPRPSGTEGKQAPQPAQRRRRRRASRGERARAGERGSRYRHVEAGRPPRPALNRAELANDPLEQFRRWFAEAEGAVPAAEKMALATASADGSPSVRMVLMKQADEDGIVFFSHYPSRKGRELAENPRAAL